MRSAEETMVSSAGLRLDRTTSRVAAPPTIRSTASTTINTESPFSSYPPSSDRSPRSCHEYGRGWASLLGGPDRFGSKPVLQCLPALLGAATGPKDLEGLPLR